MRSGLVFAPFLGFAFGIGWTPCIGPTLGAVQVLAIQSATAQRGAILSAAYCVGLGLPFILMGLFLDKAETGTSKKTISETMAGETRLSAALNFEWPRICAPAMRPNKISHSFFSK